MYTVDTTTSLDSFTSTLAPFGQSITSFSPVATSLSAATTPIIASITASSRPDASSVSASTASETHSAASTSSAVPFQRNPSIFSETGFDPVLTGVLATTVLSILLGLALLVRDKLGSFKEVNYVDDLTRVNLRRSCFHARFTSIPMHTCLDSGFRCVYDRKIRIKELGISTRV
jgi:hypothetical protein